MAGLLNTTAPPGFNDTSSFVFFRTTEHVVAHLLVFIVLCVPALLLNIMNSFVILSTSAMKLPIKILLVNIILSNIVFVVGVSMYMLGFAVKVLGAQMSEGGADASCRLFLAVYIWGSFLRLLALPMFGVVTFIIIKTGIKNVRVKLLVCACVVKWIGTLAWSVMVFTPIYQDSVRSSDDGVLCIINASSAHGSLSPVYYHVDLLGVAIGLVSLLVSFVLILRGYFYVRRSTLGDGLAKLRKAMTKYLTFLIALNVANVCAFPIVGSLRGRQVSTITDLFTYYFPFVVFASLANLNPWVMICVFKNLRKKLKTWFQYNYEGLKSSNWAYRTSCNVKVEQATTSAGVQLSAVSPAYIQSSEDLIEAPAAAKHQNPETLEPTI